jgi:hypothetical protein
VILFQIGTDYHKLIMQGDMTDNGLKRSISYSMPKGNC